MATSSTILINGSHNVISISHNRAKNGGGLYFQLNSNFLIFKSQASKHDYKIVIFTSNSASEYGGAVYVSDDGMCSLFTVTDCTFQTLAMYSPISNDYNSSDAESHNINFSFITTLLESQKTVCLVDSWTDALSAHLLSQTSTKLTWTTLL